MEEIKIGDKVVMEHLVANWDYNNAPKGIGKVECIKNSLCGPKEYGVRWENDDFHYLNRWQLELASDEEIIENEVNAQKRKIQNLHKENKALDLIILKAKAARERKKEIKKNLKSLEKNLVTENKIKWVDMSFEDWLIIGGLPEYHVLKTVDETICGFWQGYDSLKYRDQVHFNDYVIDYHFYRAPCYNEYEKDFELIKIKRDRNDKNKFHTMLWIQGQRVWENVEA